MDNLTHNRNSLITIISSLVVCIFIYVVANSSNSPNLTIATMVNASIEMSRDGWMLYVPNAIIGVPIVMLWVYFNSYISADDYELENPKFIFIMNGLLLLTYALTLVIFLNYIKVGMFIEYREFLTNISVLNAASSDTTQAIIEYGRKLAASQYRATSIAISVVGVAYVIHSTIVTSYSKKPKQKAQ